MEHSSLRERSNIHGEYFCFFKLTGFTANNQIHQKIKKHVIVVLIIPPQGSLFKITYLDYARFEVLTTVFIYLVLCLGREKLNDTDLQFGINLDCGWKVKNYKMVAHYAEHANQLASIKVSCLFYIICFKLICMRSLKLFFLTTFSTTIVCSKLGRCSAHFIGVHYPPPMSCSFY